MREQKKISVSGVVLLSLLILQLTIYSIVVIKLYGAMDLQGERKKSLQGGGGGGGGGLSQKKKKKKTVRV